ncbi:IopA [Streptomyces sp. NPDC020898]|uniref:IopA n=1 Tax=Streptomyces sp. NPDC020898 TaxID=3365101 RepID=UPI0037957E63
MDQQTKLAPQMKYYEEFASGEMRWLPYLMFFSRADYQSPVLTTDSGGFRPTEVANRRYSLLQDRPSGEVSVMLGASPAFGWGAVGDANTIPSLLAREPGSPPWLNLAASAFNSTQELLVFLLHRHQLPQIRDIVVLAGLNNLVVAGLPEAGADYGQFFFSGEFFTQLGNPDLKKYYQQPKWAVGRLARRLTGAEQEPDETLSPLARSELAAEIQARDLDRLLELAAPTGAKVHFMLQPTATWTNKTLSPEEELLIHEVNIERSALWKMFTPILGDNVYRDYRDRLAAACAQRGISFLDASALLGGDEWLFIDQAHITDAGNKRLAAAISRVLTPGGVRGES